MLWAEPAKCLTKIASPVVTKFGNHAKEISYILFISDMYFFLVIYELATNRAFKNTLSLAWSLSDDSSTCDWWVQASECAVS